MYNKSKPPTETKVTTWGMINVSSYCSSGLLIDLNASSRSKLLETVNSPLKVRQAINFPPWYTSAIYFPLSDYMGVDITSFMESGSWGLSFMLLWIWKALLV